MSKLGELMHELMDIAHNGDPARCLEPMAGTTRQVEGLRSEGRFGEHTIVIDEPVGFGGTGTAPNPAEVALAALGASLEVTLRCYAEYSGIDVQGISVELEGALDNRGFFGANPDVRSGFIDVGVRIKIRSGAEDQEIAALMERVSRCCPVLDIFRSPTPVRLQHVRDE